jgi:hypothetical protein
MELMTYELVLVLVALAVTGGHETYEQRWLERWHERRRSRGLRG